MEIHYGVILADRLSGLVVPEGWGNINWSEVNRNGVTYQVLTYFASAPENFKSQLDFSFTAEAAYTDWLKSFDLPNLPGSPSRTISPVSLVVDFRENTLLLNTTVSSHGGVPDQDLPISVSREELAAYMAPLQDMIKEIIRQKIK